MLLFVVVAEEIAAKARGWANSTLIAFYFAGRGRCRGWFFAAVNILPDGWRALYVIGAVPMFLVALLRRRLPETKRFRSPGRSRPAKRPRSWTCCRTWRGNIPARIATVMIAAAAFGFAISPATFLAQKYLQEAYHYTPGEVSLVLIPGGLFGLGLTIAAGRLSRPVGPQAHGHRRRGSVGNQFPFFFGHAPAWAVPILWILGFFGFFAGDTLIAGFALEIVPTHYRATVGGLRYAIEIGAGAAALALEGVLYDRLGSHGPAIQWLLASIPITMIAILFLPEPAGKSLEEMSGA